MGGIFTAESSIHLVIGDLTIQMHLATTKIIAAKLVMNTRGVNYPRRARSASAWILFSLWMYVCMFVCMLPL